MESVFEYVINLSLFRDFNIVFSLWEKKSGFGNLIRSDSVYTQAAHLFHTPWTRIQQHITW
jgi:hypothetical protein